MEKVQNVSMGIWHRIHQVLIESKENSIELLNDHHISDYGMDSKKNKFIADMYEKEIREISDLLKYTSEHNGIPF